MPSCIEDGFTTNPADQPTFSTDCVELGEVFTDQVTITYKLMVYNRHSKGLNISNISLSGEAAEYYRLNVDGISGHEFANVDIRPKDSIFVLVEARLPANGSAALVDYRANIDFTANGRVSSVGVTATGRDVKRLTAVTLESDTRFSAEMPYVIFDSLVVAPGVTMTVEPGANLLFHDKSSLIVRGTLISEGTAQEPVTFAGDRTGKLVGDVDFEIMSRQWTGVFFTATSTGNRLSHSVIKNTVQGVAVVGDGTDGAASPRLDLLNCRFRNSAYCVLEAAHAAIRAVGCEFAEGGTGLVNIAGGKSVFNHCTFANNYLYAVISGPAIAFSHLSDDADRGFDDGSGLPYAEAEISNSLLYGYGGAVFPGDFAGSAVYFRNCLLKGEGEDDDNFIGTIWDEDPLFWTVRSDYFFDYRLQPDSPAIGVADPSLSLAESARDFYGLERGDVPDLGAYVFNPDYTPTTE